MDSATIGVTIFLTGLIIFTLNAPKICTWYCRRQYLKNWDGEQEKTTEAIRQMPLDGRKPEWKES